MCLLRKSIYIIYSMLNNKLQSPSIFMQSIICISPHWQTPLELRQCQRLWPPLPRPLPLKARIEVVNFQVMSQHVPFSPAWSRSVASARSFVPSYSMSTWRIVEKGKDVAPQTILKQYMYWLLMCWLLYKDLKYEYNNEIMDIPRAQRRSATRCGCSACVLHRPGLNLTQECTDDEGMFYSEDLWLWWKKYEKHESYEKTLHKLHDDWTGFRYAFRIF